MIADVICYWENASLMALDGVTSFLRLKDVTNTCKRKYWQEFSKSNFSN